MGVNGCEWFEVAYDPIGHSRPVSVYVAKRQYKVQMPHAFSILQCTVQIFTIIRYKIEPVWHRSSSDVGLSV